MKKQKKTKQGRKNKMADDDINGVWRTVGGRRIFIKNGEDLSTAMKNSGKFNNQRKKGTSEEKQINEEKITNDVIEDYQRYPKNGSELFDQYFDSEDFNKVDFEEWAKDKYIYPTKEELLGRNDVKATIEGEILAEKNNYNELIGEWEKKGIGRNSFGKVYEKMNDKQELVNYMENVKDVYKKYDEKDIKNAQLYQQSNTNQFMGANTHSYILNDDLRNGKTLDKQQEKVVKSMDKLIASNKADKDINTVRHVRLDYVAKNFDINTESASPKEILDKINSNAGKTYKDKAYTSLSTYKNGSLFVSELPVKMEVLVKKGTNLAYLTNISEGEALLGRNQNLKLIGATINDKGQYVIRYTTK